MKWNERYDALTSFEKGEFRRLANYLFSHTYLIRDTYLPEKQWMEPSGDYRLVSRHFEIFQEYFAVSGWILDKDDNYGVISLTNEYDHNRLRIDRFTTLFLYTCRLVYEEEREAGDNLYVVRTDTAALVEKDADAGAPPQRPDHPEGADGSSAHPGPFQHHRENRNHCLVPRGERHPDPALHLVHYPQP